jgi:hypothetical protein
MTDTLGLPPGAFDKADPSDDAAFYAPARLVNHIDAAAIEAVTQAYRERLPAGGVVLDLMSSWVSHLPPEVAFAEVIGHGMNAVELAANPRLDRWFVQDLNRDPTLPLNDGSVDAVTLCVSVQYLQRPGEVMGELRRVLRPGGPVVISVSNRCFPTKAVAIWRALDRVGQTALVRRYLEAVGFERVDAESRLDGRRSDPLTVVVGHAPSSPTDRRVVEG